MPAAPGPRAAAGMGRARQGRPLGAPKNALPSLQEFALQIITPFRWKSCFAKKAHNAQQKPDAPRGETVIK